MPLSESERRCVDLACEELAKAYGGQWQVSPGPTLDEQYPNTPSPEVLVTNGTLTAAIEVTAMRGGSIWSNHFVGADSLKSQLQPETPGRYLLIPPDGFILPIAKTAVGALKEAVNAAARSVSPDGAAVVRVRRRANMVLSNPDLEGHLHCCQHSMNDELREASSHVTGAYFLQDCDQWEHQFMTEDGRRQAIDRIVAACRERDAHGKAVAEWSEEWPLCLLDEAGSGVEMLCATQAVSIPGAVREDVFRAVDAKSKKFQGQRWADLHVLVIDARFTTSSSQYSAI